jgi:hypothetical protein
VTALISCWFLTILVYRIESMAKRTWAEASRSGITCGPSSPPQSDDPHVFNDVLDRSASFQQYASSKRSTKASSSYVLGEHVSPVSVVSGGDDQYSSGEPEPGSGLQQDKDRVGGGETRPTAQDSCATMARKSKACVACRKQKVDIRSVPMMWPAFRV